MLVIGLLIGFIFLLVIAILIVGILLIHESAD